MAHIILYDLRVLGDPELIFAPNPCKTRYALNYKGIPYEVKYLTYPEVFSEIPKITGNNDERPTVPVIVDLLHEGKVVQDSWKIAIYLDEAYPDTPSLFNSNIGVHLYFRDQCIQKLTWDVIKLTVFSLMDKTGKDKDYFRKTREVLLGTTLEEFVGDEEKTKKELTTHLEPAGKVLKIYPYITGLQVGYADILLAAILRMLIALRPDSFNALVVNDVQAGEALTAWWKRMEKYM